MRQIFEYHPAFGYRFVPGMRARIPSESGGYLVRVNGAGFRCDREFVSGKPAGVRRILLFGDSFTAGDGVSNGKRYGDLLENLIPNLEVYNFGLPGTGTDQHYLAYKACAAGIEHDLLVIAVLVENIRRVAAHYRYYADEQGGRVCYAKPYFRLDHGKLECAHVPPPREPVNESTLSPGERETVDRVVRYPRLGKWLTKTGTLKLAYKLLRRDPYPAYRQPGHPAWQVMQAILTEWIGHHHKPVLLMPIPLYYQIEGFASAKAYQARFREVATASGCQLHDPLPDLMDYPAIERRGFRFKTDIHFSPEGHGALARSMAPAVQRMLLP